MLWNKFCVHFLYISLVCSCSWTN